MKKAGLAIAAIVVLACVAAGCSNKEKERPLLSFEAEEGQLSGVEAASDLEGYSGNGYVTGFQEPEDTLMVSLQAPTEGVYEVYVGYRSSGGDKYAYVSLNGKPFGDLKMKQAEKFEEVYAGRMLLQEGNNDLSFTTFWGWYEIDYVTIREALPRAEHQVANTLVNPNASKEALELHQFLIDNYGKFILSGQQTFMDALQLNWDYGKLPAVVGFDLMEYSPTRVANGSSSNDIERAIQWNEKGGLVTFAWHWNAPTDLINTDQTPWWKGFYTEGTTFDIEKTLASPDSEAYQLMLSDIDAIAVHLKRLQDEGIPVLWRPLHEAEGGWFWWGAKGPEPAKQLYRLMYDRLTNKHGLNNLIWIWNSEAPEWYPGDDVVDIVSVDSYPKPGDYNPLSRSYDNLVELVQDKKLVALTENGPIPDPDLLQKYGAGWSWFCTWTGEFINDGQHNSKEHIAYVLNHDYVLTLDELPDFGW